MKRSRSNPVKYEEGPPVKRRRITSHALFAGTEQLQEFMTWYNDNQIVRGDSSGQYSQFSHSRLLNDNQTRQAIQYCWRKLRTLFPAKKGGVIQFQSGYFIPWNRQRDYIPNAEGYRKLVQWSQSQPQLAATPSADVAGLKQLQEFMKWYNNNQIVKNDWGG